MPQSDSRASLLRGSRLPSRLPARPRGGFNDDLPTTTRGVVGPGEEQDLLVPSALGQQKNRVYPSSQKPHNMIMVNYTLVSYICARFFARPKQNNSLIKPTI